MTEQTDTAHRRAGRRLGAALLRGVEVAVGTAATARAVLWDIPMFALFYHGPAWGRCLPCLTRGFIPWNGWFKRLIRAPSGIPDGGTLPTRDES